MSLILEIPVDEIVDEELEELYVNFYERTTEEREGLLNELTSQAQELDMGY